MKDKRSFFAAALLIVCAAISAVLASPGTGSLLVGNLQSLFRGIDTIETAAGSTQIDTVSTSDLSSFHFLEPLGSGGGDPSRFDDTLLNYLSVEISELNSGNWTIIKSFTAQSSPEPLRIAGHYYHVNLDTREASASRTRLVRVVVAGLELGSVEVGPGQSLGRTWPIRFFIERDSVIRVRVLRSLGKSASQVANALRSEFNLCGEESAALLAGDLVPFPQSEIDVAIRGVCQEVIIPDTTKVADEATRDALASYDPVTGQMTFYPATPLLRALNIGDVMASEPGSAAPHGYLRKITAIRYSPGGIVLETVQAKLNEAISHGTLEASGALSPAGNSLVGPATGASSLSIKGDSSVQSLAVIDEGDGFTFQRDIDVTFKLQSGDEEVGGSGEVRVQGSVYFNAAYNVGIGVETCAEVPPVCVDRFEAWTGIEQKSRLRITGDLEGHLQKEQEVFDVPLDPIVFFIGPVPVVLVPEVSILVGAKGEAQVEFSFEAKATSRFKAGAKWTDPGDGGKGWENLTDFTPLEDEFISADLEGTMRVEGYAKLDAKLLLYGVAGPGMDGALGIGADVQTGRSPFWKVYGHVTTGVNFVVDLGGLLELAEWRQSILDEYIEIAESPNQAPQCTYRTDVISANVNTPVFLGPRLGGLQGFFDCTDAEGEGITYSATSNVDGAIPASMTANFQSGGPRTITITATDASGGQTSFALSFNVFNSAPEVNIYGSNQVPATVQYFATATAHDLETGQFLTCDRLSWQVAAPDTLTLTGSGGSCGAIIRFNQQGIRVVTVRATDAHGAVGVKSMSVNVTAPPANRPPEITYFEVYANRGPHEYPCPDANYLCLIPSSYTIYNGFPSGFLPPQTGEYYPPLYLAAGATDPDGTTPSITFSCTTGTTPAPVTWSNEYDYPTCDPIPSNEFPVVVKVVVSDGVTSVERQHTYRMFANPN